MYRYKEDKKVMIERLKEFLAYYQEIYPDVVVDYIKKTIESQTPYNLASFLEQIYEFMGLVKPECSQHQFLLSLIKHNFDMGRPFIEVGSGELPLLGDMISKEQLKIKGGTVTVYDNILWNTFPTKAVLKKEWFDYNTPIEPNSVLVGLYPCEATEIILDRAVTENLDACIALCPCTPNDFPHSSIDYFKFLENYVRQTKTKQQHFHIEYFPSRCVLDDRKTPIFILNKSETGVKEKKLICYPKSKINQNM